MPAPLLQRREPLSKMEMKSVIHSGDLSTQQHSYPDRMSRTYLYSPCADDVVAIESMDASSLGAALFKLIDHRKGHSVE